MVVWGMMGMILAIVVLAIVSCHAQHVPNSPCRDWKWPGGIESLAAWCLGLIFLCGGMSKLMPFPGVIGPVWLEAELSKYGLAGFARFIAWSEAGIGLLLLSKTTRVLGAIMLVPLLANILAVTLSMGWRGTPWIILMFLTTNLYLLAYHFDRWRPVLDWSVDWVVYASGQPGWRSRGWLLLAGATLVAAPFAVNHWPWPTAASIVLVLLALVIDEVRTRFHTPLNQPSIPSDAGTKPG